VTTFFDELDDLPEDEAQRIAAEVENDYDVPESEFVQPVTRGRTAKQYEKKIKTVLNAIFRQTVAHQAAVPDAAAILMYGPTFAEKWGDLAEADKRVRKGIDTILDGAENPYIAAALATAPLLLQLYRNHEEALSPKGAVQAIKQSRAQAKQREPKRVRIPFTKRYMEFRFQLRLPAIKNMTNDPVKLAEYVFNNQEILEALKRAGIETVGGVNLNGSSDQRAAR
jgi:hypothetical protein